MREVIRITSVQKLIMERLNKVNLRMKDMPIDELGFNKGYFDALYVLHCELEKLRIGKK